jgi:hypothetical protein
MSQIGSPTGGPTLDYAASQVEWWNASFFLLDQNGIQSSSGNGLYLYSPCSAEICQGLRCGPPTISES